jgi:hypothetical protein
VASEYKNSTGVSLLQYDDQGRINGMEMRDNNDKTTMKGTLTYNEYGLATTVSNSLPDPPDSQNFTEVDTTTYKYDQTGAIQQVVSDKTNKGKPNGQSVSNYLTLPNGDLGITMVDFDSNQQPVKQRLKLITKDATGRVTMMDEKVLPPAMGSPPDDWSITKFYYDTDTEHLIKMERSDQNCLVRTCLDPATNTVLANIDPTGIQIFTFNYDAQGRRSGAITTGEGEIDYSHKPPTVKSNPGDPPDPDVTQTCELHYEIQTQAKILGEHPLDFFMATLGQVGFDPGFSNLDMFTSMTCSVSPSTSASSGDFSFKWVRFWETQPEGKPPGS